MIWNKSLEVSVIEQFIWVVNLIGTVAFAASGALTGMKKGMDLFGVCMLGLVTAVGGGVIRDLILGLTPPMAFSGPHQRPGRPGGVRGLFPEPGAEAAHV